MSLGQHGPKTPPVWPSSRNHRIFYGEEGPLDNALDSLFCLYQLKPVVVRYLPPTCLAVQQCIASTHKTYDVSY